MKKLIYIFVVIIGIVFAACEKTDDVANDSSIPTNPDDLYAKTEYNLAMRDFAMAVNEAINANTTFRKLVYSEAIKKLDGAFDVVITHIADKKLTPDLVNNGGLRSTKTANPEFTVADLLEDAMMTVAERTSDGSINSPKSRISNLRSLTPSQSIIQTLTDKYPELQVSVPVHVEDLEDPDYIPPVAFISKEYQQGTSDYMVGFSKDEILVVDGINEPEKAVIVVGLNERLPYINSWPNVPAPNNLTVSTTSEGVQLMWQKAPDSGRENTSGYSIERKGTEDSDYKVVGEIYEYDNLGYFDNTTESNRSYLYRVRAFYSIAVLSVVSSGRKYSDPSNICSIDAPSRPNAPLTFTVTQLTSNYAELRWSTAPSQYIANTKIYKSVVGTPSYNLFRTFNANQYNCFDTGISGGQVINYAIQNETSTGKSNILYDYIHVAHRNPSQSSPVRIKKVECIGRDFEPWGMGPPEFRVKVVGANKTDKKTFEIAKCIYLDFDGSDVWGWDRTQHLDRHVHDWPFNLYETNYDVMTVYLMESDSEKWKELSFQGKIAGKAGANLAGKDTLSNVPVQFNAGIDTEAAITMKYDFFQDEDLGCKDYYYYEPIDKMLEFSYKNSTVKITFGQ